MVSPVVDSGAPKDLDRERFREEYCYFIRGKKFIVLG